MNDFDPGVCAVVAWLQALGFTTTDSGDGVTKLAAGDTDALPVPHVFMPVKARDLVYHADRLRNELARIGVVVVSCGVDGVSIHASYDAADGSAILGITGLDDAALAAHLPPTEVPFVPLTGDGSMFDALVEQSDAVFSQFRIPPSMLGGSTSEANTRLSLRTMGLESEQERKARHLQNVSAGLQRDLVSCGLAFVEVTREGLFCAPLSIVRRLPDGRWCIPGTDRVVIRVVVESRDGRSFWMAAPETNHDPDTVPPTEPSR